MSLDQGNTRQIVPRWRPFSVTNQLHELGSAQFKEAGPPAEDGHWKLKVQEWERQKNLASAWSLVEAAVVENRGAAAAPAAEFLLSCKDYVPPGLRSMALEVLRSAGPTDRILQTGEGSTADDPASKIRELRGELRQGPRNAVTWVDLAHAYCTLGNLEAAGKAIQTAIALAPQNRFVLRSAAAFYVVAREPDRAHQLLVRTPAARRDPWLVAAEIAIAPLAGRATRLAKDGLDLIKNRTFAPIQIAELTAALGSLELNAGKLKKGRNLLLQGLQQPTDNSVAQVQWADRVHKTELTSDALLQTPFSFEARAWTSFIHQDITQSVNAAKLWTEDQPFAMEAWGFLSYLQGCVLHDYEGAIRSSREALVPNPDSNWILNNYALALARHGDLSEAALVLSRVTPRSESDKAINLATRGLLEFRAHRVERGRELYLQAMEIASKLTTDPWLLLRVKWYFAYEETWANPAFAAEILSIIDQQTWPRNASGSKLPSHIDVELRLIRKDIAGLAAQPSLFPGNRSVSG